MQAAGDLYGNACSQAALDLQHEIAEMLGARPPDIGGWLYEPDPDSIAATAQKHAKSLEEGDVEGFVRGIREGARYYAERGANSTMAQTARKQAEGSAGKSRRKGKSAYGVKFARVPMGPTNCDVCIMLASRGFVYLSKESAGEFDKYHPHCDCRIIPSYGDATLEGYDVEYYRDCYEHPEEHPEIREAQNARRRELYAKRKRAGKHNQEEKTSVLQSFLFSSTDLDYDTVSARRVPAPKEYWEAKLKVAESMGGQFQIADNIWLGYLRKRNGWAVTYGDTAVLRQDATRSEIAEEVIHIRQNHEGLFVNLGHNEREAVVEYLAHVELLEIAEQEGFSKDEIDLIIHNRDMYYSAVIYLGLGSYVEGKRNTSPWG